MIEKIDNKSRKILNDVYEGRILGASNHIKHVSDVLVNVSKDDTLSKESRLTIINTIIEDFVERRGESSFAIAKEFDIIKNKINEIDILNIEKEIESILEHYFETTNAQGSKLIEYALLELDKFNTFMLFDYSSTVENIICALKNKEIIIVESRAINGGYPYVKKIKGAGHKITFIPDVSMRVFLDKTDAVLIGVETFYPDGTAFNTVGSDILAELCEKYHVPFYATTDLSKLDPRAEFGIYKKEIGSDLSDKITKEWPDKQLAKNIQFYTKELVSIAPEYIKKYITEKGIVSPSAIFMMGRIQ